MENKIEVKTRLGTLVAYPSTDESHPGIYIDLKREGETAILNLAYIECETAKKDIFEEHSLCAYIWGDALYEDITYGIEYNNIEDYFKMEPYNGVPDVKLKGGKTYGNHSRNIG